MMSIPSVTFTGNLPLPATRPAAIPQVSAGIDGNPARFLRGNSDDFLSPNRILGKVDDFVQGFPTVRSSTPFQLMDNPFASDSKAKDILKKTGKSINTIFGSDFGAALLPKSIEIPGNAFALDSLSPDIGAFASPSSPAILADGMPSQGLYLPGLSGLPGTQPASLATPNILSGLMPSGGAGGLSGGLSPDAGMFANMLSGLMPLGGAGGLSGGLSPDAGMFANMLSGLMPSGGAGGLSGALSPDAGMFANMLSGLMPSGGAGADSAASLGGAFRLPSGGLPSGGSPAFGGFPLGSGSLFPPSALLQSQTTVLSELTKKPSPALIRDLTNFNPLIWQNPSTMNVMLGSMDVQNKIFGGNGLFTPPGFNTYPLYPFIAPPPVPFNGYNIPIPNHNGIRTLQQSQIFPTTFLTDSPFFFTQIRPFAVAQSQTITPFPAFAGLVHQLWPPNGVPPWI